MPRYLVAVNRPNGTDPASLRDETMARDIDALNDEMVAKGVRVFVGGLHPVSKAKTLRLQPDGGVSQSDGPCGGGTDYLDGLWVLEAADTDAALEWARKAAVACRATIELRAFF